MTAHFVRERRCVICEHRVHPVPDRRAPASWDSRCDEGCECTTAFCQPFRVFTDGTTDRSDRGPYSTTAKSTQLEASNTRSTTEMTTQTPYTAPSADDFLLGGSVPSAKFPIVGTTVSGRITERPTVEQQRDYTTGELKFWDDGKPQQQLVVTVSTDLRDPEVQDDDGSRRFYVKGSMKNAVAQAVRSSGARGLEVGGVLTITYSGDGERKNPKFNAPKNFTAVYTAAAAAELHTPEPTVAAPVASPVPGLTPEQIAAAMANPATAALIAQQAAQTPGDVPAF